MDELEVLWPDPDRRDDALARIAVPVWNERLLTECERRVLLAASAGLDRKATAFVYGISPLTVKRELLMARRKLAAKNTTHAVALAIRRGLIV